MSSNPYESPKSYPVQRSNPSNARVAALHSLRMALVILLVPALYNFVCFNFPYLFTGAARPVPIVFRVFNTIGLLLVVAAIWFCGLRLLEFVAGGIRTISAPRVALDAWNGALYIVLRRGPWFAIPGAVLWIVWIFAFYQLQLGFYTVSVPIGFAAHVLAAGLYVPLIYRWYTMQRTLSRQLPD